MISRANLQELSFRPLLTVSICAHLLLFFTQSMRPASNRISYSKQNSTRFSVAIKRNIITPKLKKKKVVSKKKSKKKKLKNEVVQKKVINKRPLQNKAVAKNLGKNDSLSRYISQIRDLVDKNKVYPKLAKRLKHQGRVVLEIVVDQSGRVISRKIVKESFSKFLNQASLKTLKKFDSFEAFPVDLREETIVVTLPLNFELI